MEHLIESSRMSVLQCVAVCCSVSQYMEHFIESSRMSVLQCVAVCCSVSQYMEHFIESSRIQHLIACTISYKLYTHINFHFIESDQNLDII